MNSENITLKIVGGILDAIGFISVVFSIGFLLKNQSAKDYEISIAFSSLISGFLLIAIGEICMGIGTVIKKLDEISNKIDK